MRLAQRLGLHREQISSLKPFEQEMRRRVWRQLLILEWASTEIVGSSSGLSFLPGLWESLPPLNVNDSELYPSIKELPPPRSTPTEMIFCMLRYEFGNFMAVKLDAEQKSRSLDWSKSESVAEIMANRDKSLDNWESMLESRYLRFCDPLDPLQFLTAMVARTALCGMRLRAHHPRQYPDGGASLPPEEKEKLWNWSLKAIQYDNLAFTTPMLRRFKWHMRSFFQYHAIVYLLIAMRSRRVGEDVENAWSVVELAFEHRPELLKRKQVIHTAVGLLTLQAWEAREVELQRLGLPVNRPGFINQLREMHANRRLHGAQKQVQPPLPYSYGSGGHQHPLQQQQQQYSISQSPSAGPMSSTLLRNWQRDGIPTGLITIDTGAPPEESMSTADWAQWDSLLVNTNPELDPNYGFNDYNTVFMPVQNSN
jgi:hypothetical protein